MGSATYWHRFHNNLSWLWPSGDDARPKFEKAVKKIVSRVVAEEAPTANTTATLREKEAKSLGGE